jgi:hypothetical protein
LFIFDYWVPWLVAAVMGLTMTVAAYLGRSRLGKAGRLYMLLGLIAVALTGIIGVGRFMGWTSPVGGGKNFYTSPLVFRLPRLRDVLSEGNWATEDLLRYLKRAHRQYPGQAKDIDRYLAAWYFWHQDAERGKQALWRLGSHSLLVGYYQSKGRWDLIEQIAQGQYLTSVAEPLVSGQVAALKALARRASNQKEAQAAKQYLLNAFVRNVGGEQEEQLRLLDEVRAGLGQEITWTEYYGCLQQVALQVQDQELLARLFFELRKLEQLHPEAVRLPPFRALPERSPTQQRINSGGAR